MNNRWLPILITGCFEITKRTDAAKFQEYDIAEVLYTLIGENEVFIYYYKNRPVCVFVCVCPSKTLNFKKSNKVNIIYTESVGGGADRGTQIWGENGMSE